MPWEKEVPKIDPPCETCRVDLLPQNQDAISIWSMCSDDWIIEGGMNANRIGISGPAIETALNISGVTSPYQRKNLFSQVKGIGRSLAKEIYNERQRTAESKGENARS